MDVLQRIYRQFFELTRSMSPAQRATLVVAPLLVLAGFGALLLQQPRGGSYTALSWGKTYTTEEIIAAEQALLQEGLTDFRREGQRLMVPAAKVDQYNAALIKFDATPADLGSQLVKKYESLGPFSTEKERQELREAMLQREVGRTLRAMPDVEDAQVVIAKPLSRGWSQRGKVTANVTLRPRPGRELSQRTVHAIRAAVANMVPDLKPADVTVLDVRNQVTFTGEAANEPFDSKLLQRIHELKRNYEEQIERDLSYIPSVGVTVNVDVDNLKSSVTRNQVVDKSKIAPVFTTENQITDSQTQRPPRGEAGQVANRPGSVAPTTGPERSRQFSNTESNILNGVSFEVTEKELIAAMPKAVQVSVAIPRDYYRTVAAQRKAAGEQDAAQLDAAAIEKTVIANVTKSVKALIPADSPPSAVIVNSIDRVTVEPPATPIPWLDRVMEWVREWGGTGGLVLFAVVALWLLRRTAPAPLAESPADLAQPTAHAGREGAVAAAGPAAGESTRRDEIQNMVRDNPEATAAIISRWLQAAK